MKYLILTVNLLVFSHAFSEKPPPVKNYFKLADEQCKTQPSLPLLPKAKGKVEGVCTDYYFGETTSVPPISQNYEKAFYCALNEVSDEPFKYLILGLLYANGDFVELNPDKAIAFFCYAHNKLGSTEAFSLVAQVLKLRDSKKRERIDYCEFNTRFLSYCCKDEGSCGSHKD